VKLKKRIIVTIKLMPLSKYVLKKTIFYLI